MQALVINSYFHILGIKKNVCSCTNKKFSWRSGVVLNIYYEYQIEHLKKNFESAVFLLKKMDLGFDTVIRKCLHSRVRIQSMTLCPMASLTVGCGNPQN